MIFVGELSVRVAVESCELDWEFQSGTGSRMGKCNWIEVAEYFVGFG
jgi:hypothetical protein